MATEGTWGIVEHLRRKNVVRFRLSEDKTTMLCEVDEFTHPLARTEVVALAQELLAMASQMVPGRPARPSDDANVPAPPCPQCGAVSYTTASILRGELQRCHELFCPKCLAKVCDLPLRGKNGLPVHLEHLPPEEEYRYFVSAAQKQIARQRCTDLETEGEASAYRRGHASGIRAARSDCARRLWTALGETPEKNSDLLEISLRVEALVRDQAGRDAMQAWYDQQAQGTGDQHG